MAHSAFPLRGRTGVTWEPSIIGSSGVSVLVGLCDNPLHREELRPARLRSLAGIGNGLSSWTLRGR